MKSSIFRRDALRAAGSLPLLLAAGAAGASAAAPTGEDAALGFATDADGRAGEAVVVGLGVA